MISNNIIKMSSVVLPQDDFKPKIRKTSIKMPTANNNTKKTTKLQCNAKIENGTRCNRRQKTSNDFCGCHSKKLPYGRFDTTINATNLATNYIKVQSIKIDGVTYLLDEWGVIYTDDDVTSIVGHYKNDSITWFN